MFFAEHRNDYLDEDLPDIDDTNAVILLRQLIKIMSRSLEATPIRDLKLH